MFPESTWQTGSSVNPIITQRTNYIKKGYELQMDYQPTFEILLHAGFTHSNKRSDRHSIIDCEKSIPTKKMINLHLIHQMALDDNEIYDNITTLMIAGFFSLLVTRTNN